ncbi:hypothetical protein PM082_019432 [Marasmius tenuissimus]|nr:hypothetical protein PM082_019432 [Marasmius tenuissimus]
MTIPTRACEPSAQFSSSSWWWLSLLDSNDFHRRVRSVLGYVALYLKAAIGVSLFPSITVEIYRSPLATITVNVGLATSDKYGSSNWSNVARFPVLSSSLLPSSARPSQGYLAAHIPLVITST